MEKAVQLLTVIMILVGLFRDRGNALKASSDLYPQLKGNSKLR